MLRDGLWTEVTRSEHHHEREGLAYVRRALPDREPYRAWSNFTFVAEDGKLYEVDLLVVTPGGVYLVELKAWSGKIEGDPAHWTWTTLEGKRRTVDNPRLLADRKAKKLKSLLLNQPALRRTDLRLYVEG